MKVFFVSFFSWLLQMKVLGLHSDSNLCSTHSSQDLAPNMVGMCKKRCLFQPYCKLALYASSVATLQCKCVGIPPSLRNS